MSDFKHGDLLYYRGYFGRISLPFHYRQDPVPRTGGFKGYGNYLRHMRTTQERRWAIAHKKYVRGKRTCNSLPTHWDDFPISNYEDRSWKNCTKRKHQWKIKRKIDND